jgi:hypothetical protein
VKKRFSVFFLLSLLGFQTEAYAEAKFDPFDKDEIRIEGAAGVKRASHGITVYIGGLPGISSIAIGTITDGKRYPIIASKEPVSKEIANLAAKAGGDAVILINDPLSALNKEIVATALEDRRDTFLLEVDDGTKNTPSTFIVVKFVSLPVK